MESLHERGQSGRPMDVLAKGDGSWQDRSGALGRKLEVRVNQDETQPVWNGKRDWKLRAARVRGRNEEQASQERRKGVVAMPGAVGGVLGSQDGREKLPARPDPQQRRGRQSPRRGGCGR